MFYTKNLQENEEIIILLRKSSLAYRWKYIIDFVLFVIPFFFLVPLFDMGGLGKFIFFFLVAIALLYLLRIMILMSFNCLLVTDKRLINYGFKKFFDKKVIEIDLSDVTDISYSSKGVLQNTFNIGSLDITWQIKDKEKLLTTKFVKNPAKVQRIILDLIKLDIKYSTKESSEKKEKPSYQATLVRMKEELGYPTLLKLVKSLEDKEEEMEEEQAELVPEEDVDC
ncbi:MAG: PH domain-containing protein [Patescibacteria group bacterium]